MAASKLLCLALIGVGWNSLVAVFVHAYQYFTLSVDKINPYLEILLVKKVVVLGRT